MVNSAALLWSENSDGRGAVFLNFDHHYVLNEGAVVYMTAQVEEALCKGLLLYDISIWAYLYC
jgi:hypothetical protein